MTQEEELLERARVVSTRYAVHDMRVGGVVCFWCGEWCENDSESPEDNHTNDCLVTKVRKALKEKEG